MKITKSRGPKSSESRLHTTVCIFKVDQQNIGHRSEAPKMINVTVPATTDDTVARPGRFQSGAAEDAPVLLAAL